MGLKYIVENLKEELNEFGKTDMPRDQIWDDGAVCGITICLDDVSTIVDALEKYLESENISEPLQ